MSRRSDEELIRALGNGDENALRVLVDRYTPSIYRFSIRYTGDESLAQDVSQEVFLKLYRFARTYKADTPFKTWLYRIVRNTSIDMARSYTYRKISSIDPQDQSALLDLEKQSFLSPTRTPEDNYVSDETAKKIDRALQSLPDKQRTAVILKYFEEMAIKEIAGIMDTTVSAVESLLVRAKRNLLTLLNI